MRILFAKQAKEKFAVLRRHGLLVTRNKVLRTVVHPESIDDRRAPLLIAQSTLDATHVLRAVYRDADKARIIITFYPGRKSQYEN